MSLELVVAAGSTVTQTVVVTAVTTAASVSIGWCPAGRTVLIQNLGAHSVTVSTASPVVYGVGFVLKGGTPGGLLGTGLPGAAVDQWWYARSTGGATSVAFMVV